MTGAQEIRRKEPRERVSTNIEISALAVVHVVAKARGMKVGTLLAEIVEQWAAKQPRDQA